MILDALTTVDDADRTSTALRAGRAFVHGLAQDAVLADELAPLTERLERVDSFENSWALARAVWVTWIDAHGSIAHLRQAATWFAGVGVDRREARMLHLANGLAWETRGDTSVPEGRLDLNEPVDRFVLYVLLERRRFLFQFDAIDALLESYRSSIARNPFLLAMRGLVRLQGDQDAQHEGLGALTTAWDASRSTELDQPTADVCLHAVWLAHQLPDQGATLLEWCERGEREARPSAQIRRFRLATALRLVGRSEEAVDEIDGVLAGLSGSSEFTRTFSEQCLQQRNLAVESARQARAKARELEVLRIELDRMRTELAEAEARAVESQQSGTARSVEVVTFFTAAIGFAVGAVNIGGSATTANDKLVLIAGLGLAMSCFATLIVLGLSFLSDQRATSAQLHGRRAAWRVVLIAAGSVIALQAALVIWVANRS